MRIFEIGRFFSHNTSPVFRLRQISLKFFLLWPVMKILFPQMLGEECPVGVGIFQINSLLGEKSLGIVWGEAMPFMFGPRNCGQIDSAEAFDDIKKLLKAVIINMTNRVFDLGIILIYDVLIY